MYCAKCGRELLEGAKFCPECGANAERPSPRPSEPHTVQFRCKGCGSVMQIASETPVLHCPTCGSSELIIEDKDVTIERMRSKTKREGQQIYREVELGRQQIKREELHQKEEQKRQSEEHKEVKHYWKGKQFKWTVVFIITGAAICASHLSNHRVISGILALAQVLLFALSLLMGMKTILSRCRYLHIPMFWLAVALFPVIITANNYENDVQQAFELSQRGQVINWDTIELSESLPKPAIERFEIDSNESDKLQLSAYGIAQEQYDAYVDLCKKEGFSSIVNDGPVSFEAYNDDGYNLDVTYFDFGQELMIKFKAPMELGDLIWPEDGLSMFLPELQSKRGTISENSEEQLHVYAGNVTRQQFTDYIEACKDKGFVVESENYDDSYTAFDEKWNELSLRYEKYTEIMSVKLEAPEAMPKLRWPKSKLAKKIPKPDSKIGIIDHEYETSLSVEVGNATQEMFNEYVDKCLDKGFDKNYLRNEDYFKGKTENGIDITVKYRGGRMSITVYDWSKK